MLEIYLLYNYLVIALMVKGSEKMVTYDEIYQELACS